MKILSIIISAFFLFNAAHAQVKSKPKPKQVNKYTSDVLDKPDPTPTKPKILPSRPASIKPFELAVDGDTINITDQYNLRQGDWQIRSGGDFGESVQTELGKYINGKKFGTWRTYEMGTLVKVENFYNNCLSGASEYYEEGRLVATANFYSSKKTTDKDTILVTNPITEEQKIVVINTEGTSYRDGEWKYYYLSGRLKRAEWYVLDELVEAKDFPEVELDSAAQRKLFSLPAQGGNYKQFDQTNLLDIRLQKFQFVQPPAKGGPYKPK